MQIEHHIHFIDRPDECYRQEFSFNPPVSIPALIENPVAIYSNEVMAGPGARSTLKAVPGIVSASGILHVQEVVEAGTVISVQLRMGHSLKDVGLRQEDHLLVLPNPEHLLVWVTAGKAGVFVLTAVVFDDNGATRAKMERNRGDLPLREYLTAQMLRPDPTLQQLPVVHKDVMNHQEAMVYLGMGKTTLYRKVAEGEIRRSRGFKYLRSELDVYLTRSPKRR